MVRRAALASSVVASMPTVFPLTDPTSASLCRIPVEHGLVSFEIDQATCARDRRMVRRRLRPRQPKKLAQRKRIGRTPCESRAPRADLRTRSAATGSSAQAAAPAGRCPRNTGGTGPRRIRRSRACRGSDSITCRRDARHSATGLGSPPTSTAASRAAFVYPSPSATV